MSHHSEKFCKRTPLQCLYTKNIFSTNSQVHKLDYIKTKTFVLHKISFNKPSHRLEENVCKSHL